MIEPTLPLDMPRALKPEPRPSGARRGRSAPAEAAADLFETETSPIARPERKRRMPNRVAPADAMPDDRAETPDAHPGRKRRGSATPAGAPAATASPDAMAADTAAAQSEPPSGTPADAAGPEPELPHVDPVEADQPRPGQAVVLSPDEVLLQKVEPRSFRPNERNDSWLYWLTDRSRADAALRDGMPVEPDAPLLLSDRRAVLPKLAALAEDPDWAPSAIAVLRLRRIAVEPFLQPGPEPDSYVLAGAANVSA